MKAEEDRGGSFTWDSFAGGPDAATARVREPYPAGLRSRAAIVHGVGTPIRRRVVPAGSGPPGRVISCTTRVPIESTRHRCGPSSTTGRLGGGGPPARLDGSHEGAPRTGCTPRVSTALGITPLGIVRHALSSRRPHHLALLACRVAPSRHLRSGTVVTGAGEGRIITLIHVKHVGRRIGRQPTRHAQASTPHLAVTVTKHRGVHGQSGDAAGPPGMSVPTYPCRTTCFGFTASGFSESAPRNRPTRTVPFEPGNSRGQTP